MNTKLEISTDELETLISFMKGEGYPIWLKIESDVELQTLRAGVAKLLRWLRAMNMSKRLKTMKLTKQPWSEVVRSIALSSSFLELCNEQTFVILSESLSDEDKTSLCETASGYRPKLMK